MDKSYDPTAIFRAVNLTHAQYEWLRLRMAEKQAEAARLNYQIDALKLVVSGVQRLQVVAEGAAMGRE